MAIQPGHTLVTTGVYGIIRHPSYLGLFVNALGWRSLHAALLTDLGSKRALASSRPVLRDRVHTH